jgi:hypothetical protein
MASPRDKRAVLKSRPSLAKEESMAFVLVFDNSGCVNRQHRLYKMKCQQPARKARAILMGLALPYGRASDTRLASKIMVRMRGLEPPRCHHHRLLRPARLPVPPHPRAVRIYERDQPVSRSRFDRWWPIPALY